VVKRMHSRLRERLVMGTACLERLDYGALVVGKRILATPIEEQIVWRGLLDLQSKD
jgi:hypothetical protein